MTEGRSWIRQGGRWRKAHTDGSYTEDWYGRRGANKEWNPGNGKVRQELRRKGTKARRTKESAEREQRQTQREEGERTHATHGLPTVGETGKASHTNRTLKTESQTSCDPKHPSIVSRSQTLDPPSSLTTRVVIGHSTSTRDVGPTPKVLRALDLFSGTGSVANALRDQGYHVVRVDNDPKRKADVKESILHWDYVSAFPVGYFDVVAASPPCTEYSTAMSRRRPRMLEQSDALVAKAIEIIQHFKPRLWWIENPRWGLLRTRTVVQGLPYIDLDYCQFAKGGFKKATRFWCCDEIAKRPSVVCDYHSCANLDRAYEERTGRKRHLRAIGGQGVRNPKKDEVLGIPARLIQYLCGITEEVAQSHRNKKKKKQRDAQGEDTVWQMVTSPRRKRRESSETIYSNSRNNSTYPGGGRDPPRASMRLCAVPYLRLSSSYGGCESPG